MEAVKSLTGIARRQCFRSRGKPSSIGVAGQQQLPAKPTAFERNNPPA
jgi:hypothetical protein